MIKTKIKRIAIIGILVSTFVGTTSVFGMPSITCSVEKSGFKKSATAKGTSCVAVGCIIRGKSGQTLASGENNGYTANGTHTKSVSYNGISSAKDAYAYAVDSNGTLKSVTKTY